MLIIKYDVFDISNLKYFSVPNFKCLEYIIFPNKIARNIEER